MTNIVYQSLNSNSSTSHGISASNSQFFTRKTHDRLASVDEKWMLNLPTTEAAEPDVPVHGPAELIPSAPGGFMAKQQHDNEEFLSLVKGKAEQIHQQAMRELGAPLDVLVFGELDGANPEWNPLQSSSGTFTNSSFTGKACNAFSVCKIKTQYEHIAEGTGWIAIKINNIIAVFVHVPNSIAKSQSSAITFYQKINTAVLQAGKGAIDIIMGDTNQGSADFTQNVVSKGLNTPFYNAHQGSSIAPVDAYQQTFGGTNSTASMKYDIAVYNPATVRINRFIYLSQATSTHHNGANHAAAVTDHMGMGVSLQSI